MSRLPLQTNPELLPLPGSPRESRHRAPTPDLPVGPPLVRPGQTFDASTAVRNQDFLEGARMEVPRFGRARQVSGRTQGGDASILGEAGKSIARLPGQLVEGVGGLMTTLGTGLAKITPMTEATGITPGRAISEIGQDLQDPFAPAREVMELSQASFAEAATSPLWWASVLPGEAVTLAGSLLTGGTVGVLARGTRLARMAPLVAGASPTAIREGGISANRSFERGIAQGMTPAQAANQAAATGALVTVGSTALDMIPMGHFLLRTPNAKRAFVGTLGQSLFRSRAFAEGAVREGVTEAAQEALQDGVRAAVEDDPDAFQDGAKRYAQAALVGAVLGGAADVTVDAFFDRPRRNRIQAMRTVLGDLQIQLEEAGFAPEDITAAMDAAEQETLALVAEGAEANPAVIQQAAQAILDIQLNREKAEQRDEEAGDPLGEQLELPFEEVNRRRLGRQLDLPFDEITQSRQLDRPFEEAERRRLGQTELPFGEIDRRRQSARVADVAGALTGAGLESQLALPGPIDLGPLREEAGQIAGQIAEDQGAVDPDERASLVESIRPVILDRLIQREERRRGEGIPVAEGAQGTQGAVPAGPEEGAAVQEQAAVGPGAGAAQASSLSREDLLAASEDLGIDPETVDLVARAQRGDPEAARGLEAIEPETIGAVQDRLGPLPQADPAHEPRANRAPGPQVVGALPDMVVEASLTPLESAVADLAGAQGVPVSFGSPVPSQGAPVPEGIVLPKGRGRANLDTLVGHLAAENLGPLPDEIGGTLEDEFFKSQEAELRGALGPEEGTLAAETLAGLRGDDLTGAQESFDTQARAWVVTRFARSQAFRKHLRNLDPEFANRVEDALQGSLAGMESAHPALAQEIERIETEARVPERGTQGRPGTRRGPQEATGSGRTLFDEALSLYTQPEEDLSTDQRARRREILVQATDRTLRAPSEAQKQVLQIAQDAARTGEDNLGAISALVAMRLPGLRNWADWRVTGRDPARRRNQANQQKIADMVMAGADELFDRLSRGMDQTRTSRALLRLDPEAQDPLLPEIGDLSRLAPSSQVTEVMARVDRGEPQVGDSVVTTDRPGEVGQLLTAPTRDPVRVAYPGGEEVRVPRSRVSLHTPTHGELEIRTESGVFTQEAADHGPSPEEVVETQEAQEFLGGIRGVLGQLDRGDITEDNARRAVSDLLATEYGQVPVEDPDEPGLIHPAAWEQVKQQARECE